MREIAARFKSRSQVQRLHYHSSRSGVFIREREVLPLRVVFLRDVPFFARLAFVRFFFAACRCRSVGISPPLLFELMFSSRK
jgi:hypothetical protein